MSDRLDDAKYVDSVTTGGTAAPESETPETDALCRRLQGEPAVSFSESDAEELASLTRSLERRLRAVTRERDLLVTRLKIQCEACEAAERDAARIDWLEKRDPQYFSRAAIDEAMGKKS